jgi:hypothetical protein
MCLHFFHYYTIATNFYDSIIAPQVGNENTRILLTPEESDIVMPKLESLFMNYQEERDE